MSEILLNTVRDGALASTAALLKKSGYPGCVRRDGKPCHCAKIVAGELHCGPTKQKEILSRALAGQCEKRTDHAKH